MDMGMERKTPGVSMQYSDQPQLVSQALIVAGKLVQRLLGNLEQGVAGPSQMMPGKASQLGWQGEGHQKIVQQEKTAESTRACVNFEGLRSAWCATFHAGAPVLGRKGSICCR